MTFSTKEALQLAKESGMHGMATTVICEVPEIVRLCNAAAARALEGATRYDWGRANSAELEELANEYRTAAQPTPPEFLRKTT